MPNSLRIAFALALTLTVVAASAGNACDGNPADIQKSAGKKGLGDVTAGPWSGRLTRFCEDFHGTPACQALTKKHAAPLEAVRERGGTVATLVRPMPAPPPDARSQRATVTSIRSSGDDGVVLRVRLASPIPPLRAARFFMLRRADRLSPSIPRPFSLYRTSMCATNVDGQDECELEFLIKVLGEGTRALAHSRPGDELLAVGPLGHGWPTIDGAGDPWVMIAGGIGSAPFYLGIQQALEGMDGHEPCRPEDITLIYGGRHRGFLYDIEEFRALGVRVVIATDDGSAGFHGNVVQALRDEWHNGRIPLRVRLLTCGPERMMEAVAHVAREHDLDCWLSLETYMGCGVGICNGCALPTTAEGALSAWPVAKCCVDGPVFAARDVLV